MTHDEYSLDLAVQDLQNWLSGYKLSYKKSFVGDWTSEEGLLLENYRVCEIGCCSRYDIEMYKILMMKVRM